MDINVERRAVPMALSSVWPQIGFFWGKRLKAAVLLCKNLYDS